MAVGAGGIRRTVRRYGERFGSDREGWLALFAEDATLEDPVGSEVHEGLPEIGEFWDFAHSLADQVDVEIVGPVCVAGNEAAFHLRVLTRTGRDRFMLPAIDVMAFDHDARITSMRAYWAIEDVVPYSP